MLTNFHLPRSTLFMLVCAFAGIGRMKAAYAEALAAGLPLLFLRRRLPARARGGGMTLGFTVEATDGRARLGRLETAHGHRAHARLHAGGNASRGQGLTVDAVRASGAEMVLSNTTT